MIVSLILDLLYGLILFLASPWLLWRSWSTGRYRQGVGEKLLGLGSLPSSGHTSPEFRPVWFHGVSVGEVHLLRQVVAAFRRRFPQYPVIVSSTTDTGLAEARKAFADLTVVPFPFDFSWAVARTINTINPGLIILAEGDLWPNLLLAAKRRALPVAVINARMSPRSFERYRRLGSLPRWLLQQVSVFLTQDQRHADNLKGLGLPAERVIVTGSVKFDGSSFNRDNPATSRLGKILKVNTGDLIWIAGSTQAPEEEIVLRIYQELKQSIPQLKLFLVPRHPERFSEVANLVERNGCPVSCRSTLTEETPARDVVLVDSMGELTALWGLADLAFVGGSLDGKRGGQNMIEPAGYGVPVLFGPHVWNFRETARRLVEVGGAIQIGNEAELKEVATRLLQSLEQRHSMGQAGREFVKSQQGATERTLDQLAHWLPQTSQNSHAA